MSTTEPLVDTPFVKRLVLVCGLVPAALLLWDAYRHQLGVNDVNFAIRTTGVIGLVLIVLSLLITPLRALTGWQRVISTRRRLGVLGFCYLAVHVLIFFQFDRAASVVSTAHEIVMRRYLWFGTSALVLMIPLALTSTDTMVLRLGGKSWKRLHRLVYLVAAGAVVHYYMLVKSDVRQPLAFAGVVVVLLLYRVGVHYMGLRRDAQLARARTQPAIAAPGKRFWSGELVITRVFEESHDVKTFRLAAPDGGALPFSHVAGQYLNLRLTINGRRVNRSYTIASSPTRQAYCEISVKRVPNGYASHHLHDPWRAGERVQVSAPAGSFLFAGAEASRLILLAGGIGITPMMAVIRSLTDRGWPGEVHLLFSVRAVRDFVFRDELEYLRRRFPNLHLHTFVSQDPDTAWDGPRGQITAEAIAKAVPDLAGAHVMLCGPAPMMTAMRAILVGLGVPDASIHQEAFISPPSLPADAEAPMLAPSGSGAVAVDAQVTFARTGTTAAIGASQTLLEAAEAAGVELPFECRSGICGQCKTRLVKGSVIMEVADALTATDRSRGFVLACQAMAATDLVAEA